MMISKIKENHWKLWKPLSTKYTDIPLNLLVGCQWSEVKKYDKSLSVVIDLNVQFRYKIDNDMENQRKSVEAMEELSTKFRATKSNSECQWKMFNLDLKLTLIWKVRNSGHRNLLLGCYLWNVSEVEKDEKSLSVVTDSEKVQGDEIFLWDDNEREKDCKSPKL